MAEDIVTRFLLETGQFDAKLKEAVKGVDGFISSTDEAQDKNKELEGSLGSVSKKFGDVRSNSVSAAAGMSGMAKGASTLEQSSLKAAKGVGSIGDSAGKSGGLFSGLLDKAKGALGSIGEGAAKVGGSLKASIGNAVQSAGSALGGFGASALGVLGPIGIAAAAVGATLLKVFNNTDAGATYFDGLKRSGGAAFDKLTGAVTGFFSKLNDGQSTIGKVFGFFKTAVETVISPFVTLVSLVGDLTGLTAVLAEINAEGQELAQAYDAIDGAQYKNIKSNAELEKQVSSLNIKLRDRTLTQEESLKVAAQLTELEKKRAASEIAVLEQITAAKQKEADKELKNKGEISDVTARALAEAQAAEIRAAQESENLQERASNRISAINEQANSEKRAANEKARAASEKAAQARIDAEKKAAAEEIRIANEIATARAKIANTTSAPKEEERRAQLSPQEIKVDDLSILYKKQVDDAAEAFDVLRRLKEGDAEAIAQIDAEMAENAIRIEKNKNAAIRELTDEELAIVKEEKDAKLQLIHEATATEAQLEQESINTKFDNLRDAANAVIANEEELTAALVAIEAKRQEQLNELADAAAQERTEKAIAGAQEVVSAATNLGSAILANDKLITDEKIAEYDRQIEAQKKLGKDTSQLEAQRDAEQKNAARKAFQLNKASTLAQLAIDTASAISSLTKAAAANPTNSVTFGAAGIAQFAAGLIQIVANIAQAKALLGTNAPGLFKGDPYIDGRPDFDGRDGYLRRLDKGERVVTAKDNIQHWPMLEAMRLGKLEEWKEANLDPLSLNFRPISGLDGVEYDRWISSTTSVNQYIERGPTNVTLELPRGHDKGMISASRDSTREQRRTNDLLEAMLNRPGPTSSKRLW